MKHKVIAPTRRLTMQRYLIFFVLFFTVSFCQAASFQKVSDEQILKLPGKDPLVLLNFWATWCKPCNVELAALNRLHAKFPAVRFVGVNVDDPENAGAIPSFLKKHPINFEVLLRRGKDFESLAGMLDSRWKGGIPATFVFIRGRRVFSKTSMIDEAELEQVLKKAFSEELSE